MLQLIIYTNIHYYI